MIKRLGCFAIIKKCLASGAKTNIACGCLATAGNVVLCRKATLCRVGEWARLTFCEQKAPSPCFSRGLLFHYLACFALCIFDDIHALASGVVYANAVESVYFHLFVGLNAGQIVNACGYVDGVKAIFA